MPATAETDRQTLQICRASFNGEPRTERFDGDDYLVVPVVAMVPGVRNGRLVPAEELARHVEAWNGRPVVINHPVENGTPVTANQTQRLERSGVGQLFNARWEDDRLKGELWVHLDKARRAGHEQTVDQLRDSGTPMEVSIAYFNDIELTAGTHEGIAYHGVDRNLRPDHIALLPADHGSCSVTDGCGAPRTHSDRSAIQVMADLFNRALGRTTPATHEASYRKRENVLWHLLRQEGNPARNVSVIDVLDSNEVIYHADQHGGDYESDPYRTFRRPFTEAEDGTITLGTPVVEVREETQTNWVPVDEPPRVNSQDQPSQQESNVMNRKQLIDGLITNSAAKWAESDRPALEKLSDEQLQSLTAHQCRCQGQQPQQAAQPTAHTQPAEPAAGEGAAVEAGEPGREGTGQAGEAKPEGVDAIEDEELRAHVRQLLDADKARKDALIGSLVAHRDCDLTEDELKALPTATLEKIASGLKAHAATPNYTGRPAPQTHQQQDGPPVPPRALVPRSERQFPGDSVN